MAEVITSGKVIQKPELVLEVDDFLPPGVVGIRHKTRDEAGYPEEVGDDSSGIVIDEDNQGEDGEDPNNPNTDWPYETLPVPTTMRIVSQTVRIGPDRKIVVDVIIETDDFPGITEFEARIIRDAPAEGVA